MGKSGLNVHPSIGEAAARIGVEKAVARAQELGVAMSVAVTDAFGYLLAFHRQDGAILVSIHGALEKAGTAARAAVDTGLLQRMINEGHPALLGVSALTPMQGGIPVVFDGRLVGAVGASGGALDEDEGVARAGAEVPLPNSPCRLVRTEVCASAR